MHWQRQVISLFPISIRQKLISNNVKPPLDFGFAFKTADDSEKTLAYRLVYESYLEVGATVPNDEALRITKYHSLPQTIVLVGKKADRVIGTLSIIQDNPLGLPIEEIFDISLFRSPNTKIAEISSLAVAKGFRRGGIVLFPLTRLMWRTGEKLGIDFLFITVDPKHLDLYQGILGFKRIEKKVKRYAFANNKPSIGLYLPVKEMRFLFFREKRHLYDYYELQSA